MFLKSSLFVLAIHSSLYPMVLYPWLRIAVPLFFMTSSYFLFSKLHETSADNHKAILKKFVARNLKLYLCWFVIQLPVLLYTRRIRFSNGFLGGILRLLKSFLFGSTFTASWFIAATVIGVLIIFLLNKILRNDFILLLISLAAFFIVTLESSYNSVIANTVLSVAISKYKDVFGGLLYSFPAAIFWIFLGKLFAEQKIKSKSVSLLIALTVCSCVALFVEWKFVLSLDGSYNNDSYFTLAPLCILLFICIEKIKPLYWGKSVYFKRASTIIYVTHGSLLPITFKLTSIFFHVRIPLLSFIITLIGCIAIYILIEIAINKCSKHRMAKVLKMLY